MNEKSNIAFIGMAGVGKSYFGEKAEEYGYKYIEVDKMITILADKYGVDKETIPDKEFTKLEEEAVISIKDVTNSAIDTSGSTIYSAKAMDIIKAISTIVYLSDSATNIRKRFDARGGARLIGITGKTFEELLKERDSIYRKYADIVVDVSKATDINKIIEKITKQR